jgi:hypothetical protein
MIHLIQLVKIKSTVHQHVVLNQLRKKLLKDIRFQSLKQGLEKKEAVLGVVIL